MARLTVRRAFRRLAGVRYESSGRVRVLIYVGLALLLYIILLGTVLPRTFNFHVGDISHVDIKAPFNAVDTQLTDEERKLASSEVPKKYILDTTVLDAAQSQADKLYETALVSANDTPEARLNEVAQVAPPNVSKEALQALAGLTPVQIRTVQSVTDQIVQAILGSPFTDQMMSNAASMVDSRLVVADLDRSSRLIARQVVLAVLKPNMKYSPSLTQQAQQAAERAVSDVVINKGDLLVRQGQLIDEHILQKLSDVKLLSTQPNYSLYFGFAGFTAILVGLFALYIEKMRTKVASDNRLLLLAAVVFVLVALLLKVVNLGLGMGLSGTLYYLAPIAMGSIIITVTCDLSLAVFSTTLFALLASVAFDYQFANPLITFVGGIAGALAVSRARQRQVFIRSGFVIGLANMVTLFILHLMLSTDGSWIVLVEQCLAGLGGGVLSAVLTIGVLPFVESSFGILTPMKLLELSNPNHPLLRQLLLVAPGTYHHSLIVGNLAEAAAEVVGADPLLCRVGAMFHDVGKARRPMFFIENQLNGNNPHDRIAPSLSKLIITSHAKDGVEMQMEYGLPEPVRAIAEQHHGTTVLWYFYNKALKEDKSQSVRVDDFRYAGPKPQSREAAIVMLCDAVEAAVRSMGNPNPNRIEAMIRKIVKDRLNDGQLDDCDLTLHDLEKATQAFLRTMNGIYHPRIEYPDGNKSKGDRN